MLKLLYVGPNPSEWAMGNRPGDLAAGKWSHGLLCGLSRCADVHVLTHAHERCWPKGDVVWRGFDRRLFPTDWPCSAVSFPAIYHVRERWLNRFYPIHAQRLMDSQRFDAVVTYNCIEPYQVAIIEETAKRGIPAFPIVLDGDDPRKDDWRCLIKATEHAAGIAFLSYWASVNFPSSKPRLHLDGGVDAWNGGDSLEIKQAECTRFVHTGALDKWRGLDFMRKVIALLERRSANVKIVLCGKMTEDIRNELSASPVVEWRGFVSDSELSVISREADGFLNVREPSVGDNILNFPSKVPVCLSWGKPIVSTWLDSFSPDYKDVMCFDFANTPKTFADLLCNVAGWDEEMRRKHYKTVKSWFLERKLWHVQARRFSEWIEAVINGKSS